MGKISEQEEGKATEPSGQIGSEILARERRTKRQGPLLYSSSASTALVIFPASHFVHDVLIRGGGMMSCFLACHTPAGMAPQLQFCGSYKVAGAPPSSLHISLCS